MTSLAAYRPMRSVIAAAAFVSQSSCKHKMYECACNSVPATTSSSVWNVRHRGGRGLSMAAAYFNEAGRSKDSIATAVQPLARHSSCLPDCMAPADPHTSVQSDSLIGPGCYKGSKREGGRLGQKVTKGLAAGKEQLCLVCTPSALCNMGCCDMGTHVTGPARHGMRTLSPSSSYRQPLQSRKGAGARGAA